MDSETKALLNAKLDNNLKFSTSANLQSTGMNTNIGTDNAVNALYRGTAWDFWQDRYYPHIVESYPVYIRDRAEDKGKQAFEIIKMLKDSRFLKLDTVGDFIDLMDKLIKIL